MKKIFYDQGKWRVFEAPEKPETVYFVADPEGWIKYHEAYAEAKANALEVGNPEELDKVNLVECPIVETKPEVILQWPGSAVIKDGKYILSI